MHSEVFADARTQALPAGGKPKKRRDPVKRAFFVILVILIVLVGAVGAYAAWVWNSFNSQVTVIDDVFPEGDRPAAVEGAQTILLLGSDTRGTDEGDELRGRADTIMVVHIPSDHETIQVMSIMRDNWVPIPGHREAKINAAMAWGGMPLMVETVESIIDTRIDHVAVIDFESFKGLTDAVGGVTVNNPKAFTARSGERFEEGEISLNGEEALAFVRERYAFATGDYQRAANQQLFVKGLLSKILSAETLTNPLRVAQLVDEISPFLTTDAGLDAAYAARLGFTMRDVRAGDVRLFTSPTLGTGTAGGQSIVRPDWDALEEIAQRIKDGTLDQYEPTGR